jgi:hypothetical protein
MITVAAPMRKRDEPLLEAVEQLVHALLTSPKKTPALRLEQNYSLAGSKPVSL